MMPEKNKRRKRQRLFLFGLLGLFFVSLLGYAYFRTLNLLNGFRDARLFVAGYRSSVWQADSADLYYYRGGSGKKTVVLLHGFGLGGATTWLDPMLGLQEDFHFIVPDLMWFGNSEGKVAPSLQNQARMMWQFLDGLNVRPDLIAGISYGGFVGFEMLNQRPRGTDEFLIVNSPGPVFGKPDVDSLCLRAGVKSPEELFIPDSVQGLRHLFRFVFSGEPPIPDFMLRQIFEFETCKHAEIKKTLMRELVANEAKYKASRLSAGVKNKVIWSAYDQVFPLRYGLQLADTLGAELAVLPNSGHVPNPAVRQEFRQLMRKMMLP
jgi:pimeloyl-ACP methyl ester carboxylesterase